jgi:demethylmenaquinone methyltransferase/2-methoxy-6-polyprenyl-1,4-benzoquinol methylase
MTYRTDSIFPYHNCDEKKTVQVERMFDAIAGRYDLLNHALSLGIDRYWRRRGILSLKDLRPQNMLDVATGTGDLALEACRRLQPATVLGIDISERMMQVGRAKAARAGLSEKITFERHDSAALQLEDATFDAAMVAFGIRNFEDLDKSLQEIARVLKPGGRLMILELSSPAGFPVKQLHGLYCRWIVSVVGGRMSSSREAYRYLPKSIAVFPQKKELIAILLKNGFQSAQYTSFTFGICRMYLATK